MMIQNNQLKVERIKQEIDRLLSLDLKDLPDAIRSLYDTNPSLFQMVLSNKIISSNIIKSQTINRKMTNITIDELLDAQDCAVRQTLEKASEEDRYVISQVIDYKPISTGLLPNNGMGFLGC